MTILAKFPSPYDLEAPAGAEGWQEMYPYYLLFQDRLREQEDGRFWFCDSQHWPSPFKPFDTVTVEFAVKCLGSTTHATI
jgi:pyruvate,water dikinase